MASSGTIFLTLIAICIMTGKAQNAFVEVKCNAENIGEHGGQALLECVVQTTQEVADAKIRVVTWGKEGADIPLLVFNKGEVKQQPGYRFAEPSWNEKNMNISLLITNTAVADGGDYKCMVVTDSGDDNSLTTLKVKAKYSAPTIRSIPEKITANEDSVLICNSDGGYPKGQLRWFDEHDKDWTRSAEMEVKQMDSGLFQLSSKLPLLRGSTFSKYTCVVFNASGDKEDAAIFEVPPTFAGLGENKGADQASKIVAPVVVIGSLIVGLLLLAVLLYKRRSQHGHRGVPACEYDVEEGEHHKMDEKCEDSLS